MKRSVRKIVLIALFLYGGGVYAQETGSSLKHELGFWIGASNPVPATELAEILDSTIGGGGFYRVNWPWVLYTELGLSYSVYFSRTTQKLSLVPVYAAAVYRLPIPFKMQVFLKAGGGGAHVTVRPENRQGWDPMGYAGLEFSIQAARRFRIGLRLDYNFVQEKPGSGLTDAQMLQLYSLSSRPQDQTLDARFYPVFQTNKVENGHFFHFGLMVSFYL